MTVKQYQGRLSERHSGRQDATRISLAAALAALPLAFALAIGTTGCSAEVSESGTQEAQTDESAGVENVEGTALADAGTQAALDDDAGHTPDHDAHAGHDHDRRGGVRAGDPRAHLGRCRRP